MFIDPTTNQPTFTPSDLTTFIGSPWVFAQSLAVARGERPRWNSDDDGLTALTKKMGDQHELDYLAKLKAAGKNVVEVSENRKDWTEPVAQTITALNDPAVDVIFQAHLTKGNWRGKADFLERNADGVFEPVDTKLARGVKPYMVLQLTFYADALADLQPVAPRLTHVELGNGLRETFRVDEFLHYFRAAQARLDAYVASDAHSSEYPWPSPYLDTSGLADEAEAIWRADDHLVLVAGISRQQIKKLAATGIDSVAMLAKATDEQRPTNLARATFEKLRRQAQLQKTAPPTWQLLEPQPGRGFDNLPAPSPGDLFYDIEGNPIFDADGSLEYLHGVWWADANKQEHFKPFWSHDREQERAAFIALIDFFIERRIADPNMHIYHYAPYEMTALKRLAQNYGVYENELDDFLRNDVFVDLYRVTRQALQASVESYSIKKIEKFYMRGRQAELQSGDDSIALYEAYRETGDQSILDGIADYNEEDCKSTYLLRKWLLARRREANEQFGWLDRPIAAESEDSANSSPPTGEISDRRILQIKHCKSLHEAALATDEDGQAERAWALRLAAEMLNFHHREGNAKWWSMFHHYAMSLEDLVVDGTALGGLEPIDGPEEAAADVRRFSFPPQDYKLRVGDGLKDPIMQWPCGAVVAIDEVASTIDIKLAGNATHELPEAVIPWSFFTTDPIEDALLDVAYDLEREPGISSRFPAAEKLLFRELPLDGAPVQRDSLPELRELLDELGSSYIPIQGPPGAGKSHTAADLIVDQLIKGKRVGVAATTHSAINTLLAKVEEFAIERGHRLAGAKKISNSKQKYESPNDMIASVTGNDSARLRDADLVAGTQFMFSREQWRGMIDVMFIDEAGQMSLADSMAIATATHKLVLVGDPAQLPQVLQATHALGAGCSALAHVIGDHQTIPPERGVFLASTYRLHPEICEFVSETFYESRLHPQDCTKEYVTSDGTGLRFIPVEHSGNRQDSVEEVDAIALEIERLRAVGVPLDEMMVVAPYNAQVDRLRRALPTEVRVGTVDKFQGQEKLVVFYSLTASGGDEISRGLDFLFSAERFNVAVSRGKALAYLVASPALINTECKTVREMRLVNAACGFVAAASNSAELDNQPRVSPPVLP
ncbi:MAG: TM0106 family RecB-like putative nuclease [Solirubrobacterales bacterium]